MIALSIQNYRILVKMTIIDHPSSIHKKDFDNIDHLLQIKSIQFFDFLNDFMVLLQIDSKATISEAKY